MDRFGYTKMQITGLRDMDLLYPNTTYVHASHFTDKEWALARDSGGNVSFAPQIEVQMGHGWAPAVTALAYGIPIGLSSDVATTAPSDQFTQMHSIFGSERGRKHQEAWEADLDGLQASPGLITSRQVLSWATLGGAEVAGIADRTGSITPGKKADIVIIDGSAVNVAPIIDPVGAVVCAADVSNVKTVLVDGEILKQDFRLEARSTRRARTSRRRATTSSRSSASPSRAGCRWERPRRPKAGLRSPKRAGPGVPQRRRALPRLLRAGRRTSPLMTCGLPKRRHRAHVWEWCPSDDDDERLAGEVSHVRRCPDRRLISRRHRPFGRPVQPPIAAAVDGDHDRSPPRLGLDGLAIGFAVSYVAVVGVSGLAEFLGLGPVLDIAAPLLLAGVATASSPGS